MSKDKDAERLYISMLADAGRLLKVYRDVHSMSRRQLAAKLGAPFSTVLQWENGGA